MMPMASFKISKMRILKLFFIAVFLYVSGLTAHAQFDQFNGEFYSSFVGATGVKIQAYKVPYGVTNDVGTPVSGTLLDFGLLKKTVLPTGQVLYLPGDAPGQAQYFQIIISLIPQYSMAQNMTVSFEYQNLNNPNANNPAGHGLGHKTSVFFRKQILAFEPGSPCYAQPIGGRVQLKKLPQWYFELNARHAMQTLDGTSINLEDFCHDMMLYVIINDLNDHFNWYGPSGQGSSEVFSPADKGGDYTGELTITATVL